MLAFRLDDKTLQSLSKNELIILKYIYEHTESICQMSIQELSIAVSYSPATILRFCKKLGCSGFAEFKYYLRSQLSANKEQQEPPHQELDETLSSRLFGNISATSSMISQDLLDRTFSYFNSDCPIYIFSPAGITDIPCDYFEKMLFSIGRKNVYKTSSARMCEHLLTGLKTSGLLILISTSGSFSYTINLAKSANANNIPILAITPYSNNALASLAQINFRFFTDQRENNGAEYTSRLPILYIISVIITCYQNYKEKGGETLL